MSESEVLRVNEEARDDLASKLVRWWLSDTDEMDRALISWCCTDDARETARATVDFILDAARPPSKRTHGIAGTYTAGCRCDECREAWRVYIAGRRSIEEIGASPSPFHNSRRSGR